MKARARLVLGRLGAHNAFRIHRRRRPTKGNWQNRRMSFFTLRVVSFCLRRRVKRNSPQTPQRLWRALYIAAAGKLLPLFIQLDYGPIWSNHLKLPRPFAFLYACQFIYAKQPHVATASFYLCILNRDWFFQHKLNLQVCNIWWNIERIDQTGYLHKISAIIISSIANICVVKP
jgi:hypothetical protein